MTAGERTRLYVTVVYECENQEIMTEWYRAEVAPRFLADMPVYVISAECSTLPPAPARTADSGETE